MNTCNRPDTHPLNNRLAVLLFLALFCVAWTSVVHAATSITVTSVGDSGAGTLREALSRAADGDTIDASTVSGTILLTGGELLVTNSVTIVGPGPGTLAVDGHSVGHVFHAKSNVVVRIESLTITNGHATRQQRGHRRVPFGGGIYSDHASFTISNCILSGNKAPYGGAVYVDGGLFTIDTSTLSSNKASFGGAVYVNGGTLAVHNSVLSNNAASDFGGGVYSRVGANGSATLQIDTSRLGSNKAPNGGAVYVKGGTFTLDTSTLSGNKAGFGAAVYVNGGILTIQNSTLNQNSARYFGGGILNRGGLNGSATLRIYNSTLSGNSANADHGGGVYNRGAHDHGGVSGTATLLILNSTLSDNSPAAALHGGGIYNRGCPNGCATLEIGSTILDAGVFGRNIFSYAGTVTSDGYNLCSDDGGGFLTAASDKTTTDPLLDPLVDNGGPTFTHALSSGSPAIDAGTNFTATATDQRGAGFARTVNSESVLNGIGSDGTDIGAFEALPEIRQPPRIMTNIEHVVMVMLENRSLDNVLGLLYGKTEKPARVVPAGSSASFDGVAGKGLFNEYQLNRFSTIYRLPVLSGVDSLRAPVFDPHEEFDYVTRQLFGDRSGNIPTLNYGTKANMKGFAYDFDATYETTAQLNEVMGTYTPQQLPVLNGLARNYAVSDRWFSSVPTQTDPNRAFSICGTSLGRTDNEAGADEHFNTKTLWNALPTSVSWALYYHGIWHNNQCFTEYTFPQIDVAKTAANNYRANSAWIGLIADFYVRARAGMLPDFTYLEPAWGYGKGSIDGKSFAGYQGNDYHPPTWVGPGEAFVNNVYEALIANTNTWAKTLLIVTFDEHGGTYDHVDPGWGATPPDSHKGENGFQFNRYGPRVPTILISPWIPAGTVFRAPTGSTHPFDHTSLIATLLKWKGVDPKQAGLGNRVASAPTFESALGGEPRNDIPTFVVPAGYAHQGGGPGARNPF